MKTPKQKTPKKDPPKKRIYDSLRKEGRGMQYRPADEGPNDRITGKDMRPEVSATPDWRKFPEKYQQEELAKGGLVGGRKRK